METEPPATFGAVLTFLRTVERPCEPPVGIGCFDILYVSERELVVWYSPAREHQRPGEVCIPAALLAAAWTALVAAGTLDEARLEALAEGQAAARWLLAVLAQLPWVRVGGEPVALLLATGGDAPA